jgi:hypothetical protein
LHEISCCFSNRCGRSIHFRSIHFSRHGEILCFNNNSRIIRLCNLFCQEGQLLQMRSHRLKLLHYRLIIVINTAARKRRSRSNTGVALWRIRQC